MNLSMLQLFLLFIVYCACLTGAQTISKFISTVIMHAQFFLLTLLGAGKGSGKIISNDWLTSTVH